MHIPLLAEQADKSGIACTPAMDEINTMFPDPDSLRSGCAS